MVNAQLIPIPALSDNYIWMLCKDGHAVVVDPGESAPVEAVLEQQNLTLDAILLTHHHGDHVGGVLALQQRTGAVVYGPASERLPACDHRLIEGDEVQFARLGVTFQVLDIPGHTAGHIAYYGKLSTGKPLVFCGDTLFAAGCGRLFEGTATQMVASLGKLRTLPPETLVCCAHEYTLGLAGRTGQYRFAATVEIRNATSGGRGAYLAFHHRGRAGDQPFFTNCASNCIECCVTLRGRIPE